MSGKKPSLGRGLAELSPLLAQRAGQPAPEAAAADCEAPSQEDGSCGVGGRNDGPTSQPPASARTASEIRKRVIFSIFLLS